MEWRTKKRTSSPTPCQRRWRPAGAAVRRRRWSTSWRRSSQQREEREQEERNMSKTMAKHKIGTRDEWTAAREALLAREKEHTRLGDEIARQRRELPWVRVEKEY